MDNKLSIFIEKQFQDSIETKKNILKNKEILDIVSKVSQEIIKAYQSGNKVIIAGNGGSAADAQHMAGELVSRFYFDRPGLPAIALTTDSSIITAIGNDYSYDKIFSRQIESNGKEGDIFIGISTSGNSKNIIEALSESNKKGMISVGLTGENGGIMKHQCDYCVCVPSKETPRIQESHLLIEHIICSIVEEHLFGKSEFII
tara:strand:+ start:7621 stop:8226 length:606 start_codon:yes stop_codon:yes gene_type:complete